MNSKSPRRAKGTHPRRRFGVQAQSTAIAAGVAATALILGGVVMLLMLHKANNENMYRSAAPRAEQITNSITAGGISAIDPGYLRAGDGVDITQVLDQQGNVVASSPGAPHQPIVDARPNPGQYRYLDNVTVPGLPGKYCAVIRGAENDERYYTVVALVRANGVRHSEFMTGVILFLELPVIMIVAAVATYLLVGRTLRPVSRITKRAKEITATGLDARVPVPDTRDEIHTLATTMNEMLTRLENNREAQMRFVGDASHELRSPLTTVVGLLDLADDTDSAVDIATVRRILLPEARRMQRMVNDLLLLARADENGLPLQVSEVDLDDLVIAESARLRALGVARVRSKVEPSRVTGDPDMLGRALRNLTENAARHAASTVWITMRNSAGLAVITVSDDGPGIPAAQRERIFERFSRLDTDRRINSGAGLGLAIVQEIARAHQGSVRVVDSEFGGATIELAIPNETGPTTAASRAADSAAAQTSDSR